MNIYIYNINIKGEVRILAQDPNYLRQRLQNKLKEIGIL